MDIHTALEDWIKKLGRGEDTKRTYKRSVQFFIETNRLPDKFDTLNLTNDHYETFLSWLRENYGSSPSTQAVYSIGVSRFLAHLFLHDLSNVSPEKNRASKKEMTIQPRPSLPQFSADDIEKILSSSDTFIKHQFEDEKDKLRAYRDRAFLLTLADTGLRVHEACNLKRGDMDWREGKAVIIGKGRKQAVIRFTSRSMKAIKDYHSVRAALDGGFGKPLGSLPIFAQHSKSSGDKVKSISTATGRRIIDEWVVRVLGNEKKGTITPHSFRHYFVTMILRTTKNLKLAQGLARHSNIQVTERYAHLNDDELDQGFYEVFEGR